MRFDQRGLVPVIAATRDGQVLMLAWADREALEASLATGEMHYHSRSRDKLWRKGETSGHVQKVASLHADCDGDTVLAIVEQQGPACHTGAPTCFHDPDEAYTASASGPVGTREPAPSRAIGAPGDPEAAAARGAGGVRSESRAGTSPRGAREGGADWHVLSELLSVIRSRRGSDSYTGKLLADENRRAKKVAEEAGEYIRAAAKGEPTSIAEEAADLLYHLLVAVEGDGVGFEEVLSELRRRREASG